MWGLDAVWRERFLSYRRLVVGLSGGLDSTVLLHVLLREPKLLDKLHAVHIHHGLSQHADAWQAHCRAFCSAHNIKFSAESITLESNSNIEETARNARLNVFNDLIDVSDCLVLAHHQDDQAETLLLNLLRGTGIDGLAAMPALKTFGRGHLARPLLCQKRETLQAYAEQHQLVWVEDDSNKDTDFSRNYLRHEILPRLKARWPTAVQALNTCAAHAEKATQNLEDLACLDCPELALKPSQLALRGLYDLPAARLNQVIRVWLKQQAIKLPSTRVLNILVNEVIFAKQDATPCVQLDGMVVRRYRDVLYLLRPDMPQSIAHVPCSSVYVPRLLSQGFCMPSDSQISVRFRCGGERMFWRGHRRSLKKLFQTLGVPPWLRDKIPLIFIDNTLVAVLDFAIADGYCDSQIKEDVYDTI
ncbi:MAG: tRNA lysidine(34) synthetase TilS [Gammaproteobacteria bacterium]|nr:tRNA lysidine(34) synthetase TilS [Gammaproteobacteria bacterium]